MSQPTKKQNFLHGAALLALATAIVKVIGALYKIPLKMIIDDAGYGYFTTAYDIYSVLLMISTAGLPVAMSRMISQASSLGNYNQVRKVYKTARAIFLGLGIVSTALMMGFATPLAKWLGQPNAAYAILFLGPCALLMGIISTYRGFFQGQGDMRPTSSSQVLEAVFKLVVGLGAAFAIMRATKSVPLAAGGAILGVTVSCAFSVLFLFSKFRPAYTQLPQSEEEAMSYKQAAKGLLAIAVPITVGSAGLQLLTVVEQKLYMSQLLNSVGMSQDAADTVKGIYSMSMTIFNMPCAFIIPITVSVIPAITSYLTLKNNQAVKETEESAARITGLISLPCSVGLCLVARPVMSLLGGYTGAKLELATKLMAVLAVCIFLYAIIQYTNAVLQSHGYAHLPVINMLTAGVAKLAVVYILVGNPKLHILGAPIGAALCYAAIGIMNLIAIAKVVPQKPALLKNLLRPLLPVTVMGIVVYLCSFGLTKVLGADGSRVILCGVPVAVGGLTYLVAVAKFKSITAQDCALLPKGEKIAKFLKL